jgi:hypothetical protein
MTSRITQPLAMMDAQLLTVILLFSGQCSY